MNSLEIFSEQFFAKFSNNIIEFMNFLDMLITPSDIAL